MVGVQRETGGTYIHPDSPLRAAPLLQLGLVLQLRGHQRQHVLPTPEKRLPRRIVDASLNLIKVLKAVLLGFFATFLVGLEEASPAE